MVCLGVINPDFCKSGMLILAFFFFFNNGVSAHLGRIHTAAKTGKGSMKNFFFVSALLTFES